MYKEDVRGAWGIYLGNLMKMENIWGKYHQNMSEIWNEHEIISHKNLRSNWEKFGKKF